MLLDESLFHVTQMNDSHWQHFLIIAVRAKMHAHHARVFVHFRYCPWTVAHQYCFWWEVSLLQSDKNQRQYEPKRHYFNNSSRTQIDIKDVLSEHSVTGCIWCQPVFPILDYFHANFTLIMWILKQDPNCNPMKLTSVQFHYTLVYLSVFTIP